MHFIYRSKGSVDDWTEDSIEADNIDEAQAKLDQIYDIRRDEHGEQTNPDTVLVEILRSEA